MVSIFNRHLPTLYNRDNIQLHFTAENVEEYEVPDTWSNFWMDIGQDTLWHIIVANKTDEIRQNTIRYLEWVPNWKIVGKCRCHTKENVNEHYHFIVRVNKDFKYSSAEAKVLRRRFNKQTNNGQHVYLTHLRIVKPNCAFHRTNMALYVHKERGWSNKCKHYDSWSVYLGNEIFKQTVYSMAAYHRSAFEAMDEEYYHFGKPLLFNKQYEYKLPLEDCKCVNNPSIYLYRKNLLQPYSRITDGDEQCKSELNIDLTDYMQCISSKDYNENIPGLQLRQKATNHRKERLKEYHMKRQQKLRDLKQQQLLLTRQMKKIIKEQMKLTR